MSKEKTVQCLKVFENGQYYVCYRTDGYHNPYKLYLKWYNCGWHQKKIAEYGDFNSILFYLIQYIYT